MKKIEEVYAAKGPLIAAKILLRQAGGIVCNVVE